MSYQTLGVMLDMSRNAVMRPDALKQYLTHLAKMGYNCVMLYTEDTYEVEGEPYFGYLRGRYTADELRDLDAFAASLGMELIPCIQTLAHLQGFVPWRQVPVDCDDILLVDDPRTYEFIENLLKSVRRTFSSRRIHIGMDEAWNLGRGRLLDNNGYEPHLAIMKRHLAGVCEIVKRYDFEPMIWSDMFFHSLGSGYYQPRLEMPDEMRDALPSEVIPVYWDYYHSSEQDYDAMLYNHEQLSDKTWFAGGIWTWCGNLPKNSLSLQTMKPALDACQKHGVENIFFTMWGDDGAECSRYAALPSLYYLAEYARGNRDEAKIKAGFKRLFGAEFDDFMSLDALNDILREGGNAPKMVLYNDLFNGFIDPRLLPDMPAYIKGVAERWHALARKYRRWHLLFDTAAKLGDLLGLKYDLGIRTRAAYQADDKATLERLAREDYAALAKAIKRFHQAFEKQWLAENKPWGFDVQDIRLGGLWQRVDSCRRRLLAFVEGKISEIPELAEVLLDGPLPKAASTTYGKMVTAGRLTHFV